MLKFLIILITITSLLAEDWDAKQLKREELVTELYQRTPLPIWRRTPPPIIPSRDNNKSVKLPICRRTPPPIFPIRDKNNSVELPIWRRTPPPIFPSRDRNTSAEIPIWRRTPPPMDAKTEMREELVTTLYRMTPLPIWRRTPPLIFPNRNINNSEELQRGDKLSNKSLYKTDDGNKLSMKWIVKDIYYPNKKDLNRQVEIKNMGRWILRWDLYDKKFKFGKYNRTDYLMYSRWRFLYEPPISNIIDFFKNL